MLVLVASCLIKALQFSFIDDAGKKNTLLCKTEVSVEPPCWKQLTLLLDRLLCGLYRRWSSSYNQEQ